MVDLIKIEGYSLRVCGDSNVGVYKKAMKDGYVIEVYVREYDEFDIGEVVEVTIDLVSDGECVVDGCMIHADAGNLEGQLAKLEARIKREWSI